MDFLTTEGCCLSLAPGLSCLPFGMPCFLVQGFGGSCSYCMPGLGCPSGAFLRNFCRILGCCDEFLSQQVLPWETCRAKDILGQDLWNQLVTFTALETFTLQRLHIISALLSISRNKPKPASRRTKYHV